MPDAFDKYAHFYDAFYQDKDYEAECDFIESIFHQFANSSVKSILDLGCGTGGHALPLAERGYHITGVDRSGTMLAHANAKATDAWSVVTGVQSPRIYPFNFIYITSPLTTHVQKAQMRFCGERKFSGSVDPVNGYKLLKLRG